MEIISNLGEILSIVGVLVGGLIFIWKVSSTLNVTLSNLNTSTQRLNEHLIKVEDDVEDNTKAIANHETRITVLEKLKDK